ncbi:MAG: hypothetical protein WA782_07815 [Sulfitobacter sp.]
MAARSPADVMIDPKIITIFDDLYDTCAECLYRAKGLMRSKTYKALDSATKSSFSRSVDDLRRSSVACGLEISNCDDGKSKDLKALKSRLQTFLDALDTLEEYNGLLEILEKKSIDAKLGGFLTVLALVQGANGDLKLLQKKFLALSDKLAKAIRATRDAKIKGMLGAGIGAIGICLVPLGTGIAMVGGIGLFVTEQALGQLLKGNEDTKAKKAFGLASGVGTMADGLGKMPNAFGPLQILATGAVDIREAFINERAMIAVQKDIKALTADVKRIIPKAAKQYKELGKIAKATQKDLKSALTSIQNYTGSQGGYHHLIGMLK